MTITQPARAAGRAGSSPGPRDADRVRTAVDGVLHAFLDTKAARAPDPCIPPLVDVIREFLAGGKRLRPMFCYAGWTMAGGDPASKAIVQAGAGLELFHSFALIHDDIMDASDSRRGRPTVHRVLASRSPGRGEALDAARFGTSAAILVGDLCMVWSDELMRVNVAPHRTRRARPFLTAMRTELMAGQYLDICADSPADPLDRAWRVIRHKTAAYTVERPLQIGAALAGGDDRLLAFCTAYGRPLGEAFQLRDDLLGVFGDAALTGKSNLDDLRDGKRTVLILLTYQRATPAQRAVLRRLHGRATLDQAGADEIRSIIRATGADALVEQLLARREDAAIEAVRRAPISAAARQVLTDLARAATRRDA
ncbi:polyprenyl synthetase family protein [Actinomycetes bacterium KLBMP 9797]